MISTIRCDIRLRKLLILLAMSIKGTPCVHVVDTGDKPRADQPADAIPAGGDPFHRL